jgi:hypothetical protein
MAVSVNRTLAPWTELHRRIRSWWHRNATLRQLDHCDERDVQRILHDLNVTRSDLAHAVTRGAYPKLLLPEMVRALGLRAETLKAEHPSVVADLRRVCSQCPDSGRCRHELDADTAATNYHEFCRNAATLDALLAEAARGATSRHAPGNEAADQPGRTAVKR